MTQMDMSTKQTETHRHLGQTCGCPEDRQGEWGREGWGVWG